jgi:hypothetical protein
MDYKFSFKEKILNGFLHRQLKAMRNNYEEAGRPRILTPLYRNMDYSAAGVDNFKNESPALAYRYFEGKQLCAEGRITWAAVIQANSILFNLEENIDSASVFYVSGCEFYEKNPTVLYGLSNAIYEYKDNGKTDKKDFVQLGEYLRDEEGLLLRREAGEKRYHLNLEHKLLGNSAYFTSVFIVRENLYYRVLSNKLIPVLHLPEKCHTTMILPVEYWTDAYKKYYIEPEFKKYLEEFYPDELAHSFKGTDEEAKEFLRSFKKQ